MRLSWLSAGRLLVLVAWPIACGGNQFESSDDSKGGTSTTAGEAGDSGSSGTTSTGGANRGGTGGANRGGTGGTSGSGATGNASGEGGEGNNAGEPSTGGTGGRGGTGQAGTGFPMGGTAGTGFPMGGTGFPMGGGGAGGTLAGAGGLAGGPGGTGPGGTGGTGGTPCPVIHVTRAIYAGNCNAPLDMTQSMQFACDSLASCNYTIQPPFDPAPECLKNFAYEWECIAPGQPTSEHSRTMPPEAANTNTNLTCLCINTP